ncbi:uncharacterized protein LOC133745306 [Rosa rugosa]|uniref:uncharacterized protein LOC133745306 n=1 Tax=Rosa rugosa TaxID=74645 RepID=UPI002B405B3C|nr:uncharacterized protein LOC133745306 [Rosa rugosa]
MESLKANDPSVKSPQVEKLQEQFMNLQQEWKSYKQSYPKTKRRSYSSSSSTMAKTRSRHLMSSLQHRMFPSEGDNWNVRTNDFAVEEIRRDRRAAIESGKLKGRRLFEDEHEETEIGYGGEESEWGSWDDWDQESEVRSLPLCGSGGEEVESGKSKEIKVCFQDSISSLTFSPCGEKMKEEEKLVTVEEKEVVENEGGNWVRCIVVIMHVLAIAALIFAICSIMGLYGYGNEHYELILVPT